MLFNFTDIEHLLTDTFAIKNNARGQAIMESADAIIKTRLGERDLIAGTYTDNIISKSDGVCRFYLKEFPIASISKIEIAGSEIGHIADTDFQWIYKPNSDVKIGIELLCYEVNEGEQISITYSGGYSTIPKPIKVAFVAAVELQWQKLTQGIAKGDSSGEVSTTYKDTKDTFDFIDSLLEPYTFKSYVA
jgi:hypothetical protein